MKEVDEQTDNEVQPSQVGIVVPPILDNIAQKKRHRGLEFYAAFT